LIVPKGCSTAHRLAVRYAALDIAEEALRIVRVAAGLDQFRLRMQPQAAIGLPAGLARIAQFLEPDRGNDRAA